MKVTVSATMPCHQCLLQRFPSYRPVFARSADFPRQNRWGSGRCQRAGKRTLTVQASAGHQEQMKVLAVLYEAKEHASENLLSCKENELGLREWLEEKGHKYVVVSDKDGDNSDFDRELKDANIVISTPFHPGYLTRERIEKAPDLKLAITAGIGSDHVDLHAAQDHGMTVAECTGSNNVSTAEQAMLCILSIVRNYPTGLLQIRNGGWDIAEVSSRAYDIENKVVGIVGAGRIGQLIMERLKGFNVKDVVYSKRNPLPKEVEEKCGGRRVELDELLEQSDIISISVPLSDSTRHMFNEESIGRMKKGAWLVNIARGEIAERDAVVEAVESGQLGGYAGDVWAPQPAPKDHPWRTMKHHGMTPHYAGNTIDAQRRYTENTKSMLQSWFDGKTFPDESFYIVREGKLADQYS